MKGRECLQRLVWKNKSSNAMADPIGVCKQGKYISLHGVLYRSEGISDDFYESARELQSGSEA